MQKRYKWKTGYEVAGIPAHVFAETVAEIDEQRGGFTATDIVECAKDESSPIHVAFEWDDVKAGNNWREHQARKHIGNIVVVMTDDDGQDEEPVRAFVNVVEDKGEVYARHYTSVVRAVNDDLLRDQILDECLIAMKQFRTKFNRLRDLSEVSRLDDVFVAMEKAESQVKKAKESGLTIPA